MVNHLWKLYNTPTIMLSRWEHLQLNIAETIMFLPVVIVVVAIYVWAMNKWVK